MRIVQVGLGGFGRNWATEIIPRVPEVEVVGTADLSASAREAAVAAGITTADRCFDSTEAAIEHSEAEAVLITASLVGHVPAARSALKAGKHVLVEKPFAASVAEARELVDLADEGGLTIAVSQNYRFFPAVRAVQALVGAEELGDLHAVELDFRRYSGADGRSPHHYLAEPLLVDMSIHHFDLMRAVLGKEPTEITCRTWDPEWSLFAGPSEGVALVEFGDVTVSYRGSWVSHGSPTAWAGEWRMDFAAGEVIWTSRGDGVDESRSDRVLVRTGRGEPTELRLPPMPRTDRAGSLTEFVSAVRDGRPPEISGRDNLSSLALTYAAVASAEAQLPIRLASGLPSGKTLPAKLGGARHEH